MSKAGNISSLKTNALLYIISLILYVLVSELIYSLMGFLFFTQNLLNNLLHASASLGLMFIFSMYAKKQLDVLNPWFDNPIKRFKKQSLLIAWLIPLIVSGLFVYVSFIKVHFLQSDMYIQYRLMLINYFIFTFIMQLNVAFDLGSYFLQQWQDSKIQQATFDKEKAQFNLELLRNQVNPHFLFNNLNTLSALIYENQDKAAGFLRMLSKVYRNILEYKNKETVSLSEELEFFDTYWNLLQIRFKDMIQVIIRVDPNLYQKKMIPLTLQLLIENAIKHNVVSTQYPLTITIESKEDMLFVSNPIQKKESLDYSSGLGLRIISSRYAYLSEKQFEVIDDGAHFTLKIPLL